uniref:Four helix bundle protein n=1 Tax=Desulfacinum infernum TaxID=35837 RepID=A0A832EKX8_9BACT
MEFHRPHKRLDVWKVSMELCQDVYRLTELLPDSEKYGLTAQIRRAAVSVPSNIAEGAGRNSLAEFRQFLSIAQGSLAELDTQLELCGKYLGLLDMEAVSEVREKIERIGCMITALRRSLSRKG